MDLSIADAEVEALRVGTSEPLSVDAFGGSPAAFHLTPGTHRRRRWLSIRRGSGGQTAGRAIEWGRGLSRRCIVVRLAPPGEEYGRRENQSRRQREKEADHQPEHQHRKGHTKPRCLKWGEGSASRKARIRRAEGAVQQEGKKSELSTIQWGSTHACSLERSCFYRHVRNSTVLLSVMFFWQEPSIIRRGKTGAI